ncbi:hypothetical protein [Flavivirga jejuensis]|uniref:STAS domain-containing protein n=1 Tax=Flavivirga jejuensis TaxID=870487 RepID=A0ABT8WMQ4_9FLAO|nr:hypothetical protein [Flavivirga jejuensis]MDO5974446.1 hypothetical protein [Flavivirga jejuensis]
MEINLSKYGKIISTDDTSNTILREIEASLKNNEPIDINALDVVISTKSARLIFGILYKKLSKINFNSKIHFKNASTTFMFAVNEGILTELSD